MRKGERERERERLGVCEREGEREEIYIYIYEREESGESGVLGGDERYDGVVMMMMRLRGRMCVCAASGNMK